MITGEKSPCYGCDERHTSCHSSCQKYQEWRAAKDKYNENVRNEKIAHRPFNYALWVAKKARKKK